MTKSTKEGTGNKAPALFFYPDGVELPDYIYICVLELSNTKISLHLLKQHTSESSLNWHGLTWIGGTFESDTGGTFHSDMPGTFQSAADGTFVSAIDGTFQSDMSGTFGPMLSVYRGDKIGNYRTNGKILEIETIKV